MTNWYDYDNAFFFFDFDRLIFNIDKNEDPFFDDINFEDIIKKEMVDISNITEEVFLLIKQKMIKNCPSLINLNRDLKIKSIIDNI